MGLKKKALAIILLVVAISMTFTACQGIEAFRQFVKLPANLIPTKKTVTLYQPTTEEDVSEFGSNVFIATTDDGFIVEEEGSPNERPTQTTTVDEKNSTTEATTKVHSTGDETTKPVETTTKKGKKPLPPKAPVKDGEWGKPVQN